MKVVIPMAGAGSRFSNAGYELPKPLLDTLGAPMIARVIASIDMPNVYEFIFVVRQEHLDKYNLASILKEHCGGKRCSIVPVNYLPQGQAKSIELAFPYLYSDDEVLVANCDQLITFNRNNFDTLRLNSKVEVIVFNFHSEDPKYSFSKVDSWNCIYSVVEKEAVSNYANTGIFYYKNAGTLMSSIRKMCKRDETTNGEFYLAPSINHVIRKGKLVLPFMVDWMGCMGDPDSWSRTLLRYFSGMRL